MKTTTTQTELEFLNAFADAAGIDRNEANEQWAGFSRQLSDREIIEQESGGARSGRENGKMMRELHLA